MVVRWSAVKRKGSGGGLSKSFKDVSMLKQWGLGEMSFTGASKVTLLTRVVYARGIKNS